MPQSSQFRTEMLMQAASSATLIAGAPHTPITGKFRSRAAVERQLEPVSVGIDLT